MKRKRVRKKNKSKEDEEHNEIERKNEKKQLNRIDESQPEKKSDYVCSVST